MIRLKMESMYEVCRSQQANNILNMIFRFDS